MRGSLAALAAFFLLAGPSIGAQSPLPTCPGCTFSQMTIVEDGVMCFSITYVPNPDPEEDEVPGSGKCDTQWNGDCGVEKNCRINGTFCITNNCEDPLKGKWEGSGQMVNIPSGASTLQAGNFELDCDEGLTNTLEYRILQGTSTIARVMFSCTSCD